MPVSRTAANAANKSTSYDQYSRPLTTCTDIAGQTFVSQVAYDGLGRPRYSVYPQATAQAAPLSLKQTYNAYGFATQTEHATTGFVYSTILSRNQDGQVYQSYLGGGLLTQTNGYSGDGLGRIATISISGGISLSQNFAFESVGSLKSRTLIGGGRTETESFGYDALDRLIQTSGSNNGATLADAGYYAIDTAGNLVNKGSTSAGNAAAGGILMGHVSGRNRLCNIGNQSSSGCTVGYDGNGNFTSYTRPTAAQSNNTPGADGALLALNGYSAFNLPTSVTKSLGGSIQASADFYYDAGYQRVRQVKRGAAGAFTDDILYVVPGGFEVHRNAAGQVISSTATVSGPDGVVATVSTQFDPNTGLPVTQASVTNLSGITTVTKLLLKDHLGSMVAEFTLTSSNAGTLVVHGFGPWGNARNGLDADQRGFTGHEHLAELGIIHMNGRLYDSVLGRFLQADPVIQAPHNAQSHNRYSYVLNNPLSFTDPSGFSAWTQWRAPVLAIIAAITMQYYLMPFLLGGTFGVACGANGLMILSSTGNAISAVASGFAAGGIAGGNIQSALQGALTAGVTFGLASGFDLHGAAAFGEAKHFGQMALHTAMGCASSAMAGGSCKSGAISGGVSAFASPLLPADRIGRLVGSSAIGAIASRLSGGKAENGALTAAFSYLFNEGADRLVAKAQDQTPRHFYTTDVAIGSDTDPDVWAAGSKAIHTVNAPGSAPVLGVGESRPVMLWGDNPVWQVSYGPFLVTNQTLNGHVFHPGEGEYGGMVSRWVASDGQGQVRIYTMGWGANSDTLNKWNNQISGWAIFVGVGRVNAAHTNALKELSNFNRNYK